MWKERLIWAAIILAAAVLYFFDNGTITLAVLVSCTAAPLLSIASFALSGRKVNVAIRGGDAGGYHADERGGSVMLSISNGGFLPTGEVRVRLRSTNRRTGERSSEEISLTAPPRKTVTKEAGASYGHCGVYVFDIEEAVCFDPLYLVKRRAASSGETGITVMPERFPVLIDISGSSAVMFESDIYSTSKSGMDPGEVYGIREYVSGDPVKNMHWKLSEKTGHLLVKELGLPVTDQLVVMLDTASGKNARPEIMDAQAAVFRSIMSALKEDDIDHSICFNGEDDELIWRKITSEEDISAACEEFLRVPAKREPSCDFFGIMNARARFAHLIFIGTQVPDAVLSISSGCRVTALIAGGGDRSEGMVQMIGFDEKSYKTELAGMEV